MRPNLALIEAAEAAEKNMYVFRRGLEIRRERRRAEERRQAEATQAARPEPQTEEPPRPGL